MKNYKKTIGLTVAPLAFLCGLYAFPKEEVSTPVEATRLTVEQMGGAAMTQFIAYKESYKTVHGQRVPYYPGIAMIEFYDNGCFRITTGDEEYYTDTFPVEETEGLEILFPQ